MLALKPRKWAILVRLFAFYGLQTLIPFALRGLREEGHGSQIWFFVFMLVLALPDLFIKLFLKPVAAIITAERVDAQYFNGKRLHVPIKNIAGYSTTKEYIRGSSRKGILLYLKNKKYVEFLEINIQDINCLKDFLNESKIEYYGPEQIRSWFVPRRYKYRQDSIPL